MEESRHAQVLEEVVAWADAIVALGTTSAGSTHRQRGLSFVKALSEVGLSQLAQSLQRALKAENDDTLTTWGDFLVTLELTREAFDIANLQSSTESPHAEKN